MLLVDSAGVARRTALTLPAMIASIPVLAFSVFPRIAAASDMSHFAQIYSLNLVRTR